MFIQRHILFLVTAIFIYEMSSQIKSNTVLNLNTLLVSDMQIYTHIRKHVDWTSIVEYNITQVISYRSADFQANITIFLQAILRISYKIFYHHKLHYFQTCSCKLKTKNNNPPINIEIMYISSIWLPLTLLCLVLNLS